MPSYFSNLMNEVSVPSHELRFASLFVPGRGISVPCDESGKVDMDSLSGRLLDAYLGARALIGREYAIPTVLLAY
jgi:hypothetical protein